MNFTNQNFIIKDYKMYKKNKVMYLDIRYKIDEIYKSNNYKEILFMNPFSNHKNKKAKIKAIIGNFVFIKSKWYKLNDYYKGYKIIKVNSNSIELENSKHKYTMRIYNEK